MHEASSARMALIYCPCPDLAEAKRIGHALLDSRTAACINILPGMLSIYNWKGVREEAGEVVLIAKTSMDAAPALRAEIERQHPYETPAILTIPLADVNAGYLRWLLDGLG